jgi:hypothetical protein
MSDRDEKSRMSSIVSRAIDASTFSELQAFTKDLESRPIERILRDVADLVAPSESKAQIVGYVIATKYRHADAAAREGILASLKSTIASLQAGDIRDRVNQIAERVRTRE